MTVLSDLTPRELPRLMDLVEAAGIDVRDWSSGGASNPKYCYEWSFVQHGETTVATLWHDHLDEHNGIVRGRPTPVNSLRHLNPVQVARAERYALALSDCWKRRAPLRVIISDGSIRPVENVDAAASRVKARMLDPVLWWVESYNEVTGQYVLVRGKPPARVVDQFELEEQQRALARETTRAVFARSRMVRETALQRSAGLCEFCQVRGFEMDNGNVYLETHHIIPLSEGGPDIESNVAALCPLHHREAHHGKGREQIKSALMLRLHPAFPPRYSASGFNAE